ncbi:MAG: hypothetical protein HY259_07025 [Chloroflexi bacterium]|nr:hypothetical protein [Chloroflexota bacterium]MBI3733197.1 hypothetical protein [Chloroflexota bacterium]
MHITYHPPLFTETQASHIAQPERRALLEPFLARFESEALPALLSLRASVIYNDATRMSNRRPTRFASAGI